MISHWGLKVLKNRTKYCFGRFQPTLSIIFLKFKQKTTRFHEKNTFNVNLKVQRYNVDHVYLLQVVWIIDQRLKGITNRQNQLLYFNYKYFNERFERKLKTVKRIQSFHYFCLLALFLCFRLNIYYFGLIKEKPMKGLSEPSKGFLISCDKNREKQALRDGYNFLSEYIQNIYSDVTEQNIIKRIKQDGKQVTLENEIKYQKQKQNKLLSQVETNVNCLIFIKINPQYAQIDPLVVVDEIMKDVHEQGRQITRFCHRILPVERAFKAEHFRMLDAIEELVNIHSQGGEIKSWMLNFKCRNNNKFNYKQVLKEVTTIATKYSHFTDIYYPQWTISVEINNHLMCLSIAQKFKETNQFKLHKSFANHKDQKNNKNGQETEQKREKVGSKHDRNASKPKKKQKQQNVQEKEQSQNNEQKDPVGNVQDSEGKLQKQQKNEAILKQTFKIPEEDIDFL